MSSLKIENISKYYKKPAGARQNVLENISFSVDKSSRDGNFISILASFNSGKSTLLKIISGIEKPSLGKVIFENESYNEARGRVAYIPEKPASFPWLNVEDNVLFAIPKNISLQKELIDIVGLTGYEKHHPHNDSLGFRFRITLARALAVKPDFILLDDPFRRMDSVTKDEIYDVIKIIQKHYNLTYLLATTNISEAIYLSNRIYLMSKNPGKIIKEINLDRDILNVRGLSKQDRSSTIRNEIEKIFLASGETLQTEVHI